jgi:hypothetical protein
LWAHLHHRSVAALSVFTLLPVEHGERPQLVVGGAAAVVTLAGAICVLQRCGWVPFSREAVRGRGRFETHYPVWASLINPNPSPHQTATSRLDGIIALLRRAERALWRNYY